MGRVHCVHGDLPKGQVSVSSLHANILRQVTGSASEYLLHSYKRSFNGFVAKLTEEESKKLSSRHGRGCVCVPKWNEETPYHKVMDFIGFPWKPIEQLLKVTLLLNAGHWIWPESASFSDEGFGPPPTKWKGTCQTLIQFHLQQLDTTEVMERYPQKILHHQGIQKAMGHILHPQQLETYIDDAIADGVDIISLSVGGFFPRDYFEDPIAIGAFHSMKNGILTSNSAGNSVLICFYHKFLALGELPLNTFEMNDMVPLIYGGDAPNTSAGSDASYSRYCYEGSLNMSLVTGKIVLCDALSDGVGAMSAGAVGTVMPSDGYTDLSFAFPLPTSCLDSNYTSDVHEYINSTSTPTANIQKTTEAKNELAPFVVWFSSRGPNPITRDILRVNILAAWTEASSLTGVPGDTRVVPYNIISGTSMACPHASGAAAYVKSFHPTWSPAAIKSALMTTEYLVPSIKRTRIIGSLLPMSAERNTDLEFAYGAGYNDTKLQLVTGENITCSAATNGTVWDLNYPSFAVSTEHGAGVTRT
ncbi:Cucumisin [Vitis vinifera]|uniref:Cucumisin n=1 Tax=Vitis vinifera TaxID=29760 RepID=A0A438ILC7_VITVI|nr:Cucumisin [Vitis vinifera]